MFGVVVATIGVQRAARKLSPTRVWKQRTLRSRATEKSLAPRAPLPHILRKIDDDRHASPSDHDPAKTELHTKPPAASESSEQGQRNRRKYK